MKHSIIDLLIRPGAFFQNAMNEKESLKIPGLIVLAGGIVSACIRVLNRGINRKDDGRIHARHGIDYRSFNIHWCLIGDISSSG